MDENRRMLTLDDEHGTRVTEERVLRSNSTWQWWMGYAIFIGLIIVASVMAIALIGKGHSRLEEMNSLLLTGTIALAVASFCHAAMNYSVRHAIVGFVLTFGISWAAESAGICWGLPFWHSYYYHSALVPTLPGGVPLFIPLAWFVLTRVPLFLLWSFPVHGGNGTLCPHRLLAKTMLCALFLASCDFILDPLATSVNAWTWEQEGMYFGVPYLNFLGWFVVGFVIYMSYFSLQKLWRPQRAAPSLLFDATYMAMIFLFFALFFAAVIKRLGSVVPMVLGIGVMGPYWIFWLAKAYTRVAAVRSDLQKRLPQATAKNKSGIGS